MMSTPTVAVITRTKNRPLLLERAIKSIMAQSYSDFVLVIVNDGGDPKPIEGLLEKYKKQTSGRVRLINNKESVGAGGACNVGIEKSDSKYITMHDDDDTWHRNFLKCTVEYLERTRDMGVATGSEIIEESVQGNEITEVRRQLFAPHITSITLFSIAGVNQFPIHSFVYAREAVKAVGLYDLRAHPIEDWDFNVRFLSHYDIGFINKPLVYYHQRVNGDGAMRNSMFDEGHKGPTTRRLNELMRKDIQNKTLGPGFVANLSYQLHELRMDIKRDQIYHTLILNTIQETLEQQSKQLLTIHDATQSIANMDSRFIGYIKRTPGRVVSKVARIGRKG